MLFLFKFKNTNWITFGGSSIKSSTKETLLGVLFDCKVCFDDHISLYCIKLGRKLNTMLISSHMKNNSNTVLWYGCSISELWTTKEINFNEIFQNNNSFTTHNKNIPSLSNEIYKFLNWLLTHIIINIFKQSEVLHMNLEFAIHFDIGEPNLWNIVQKQYYISLLNLDLIPVTINNSKSLGFLSLKIRKWKHECPCRLFKSIWNMLVSFEFANFFFLSYCI